MTTESASSKAILLGEHAVVYGRPAVAVPVSDVRATVQVSDHPPAYGVRIVAHDLAQEYHLDREYDADAARPLQVTVRNALRRLGISAKARGLQIAIRSQVPIARGMGSGPAVATAIVRALATHYGRELGPQAASDLVYQTEIILHGTPSGIDNTIVAYERPIYFVKGQPIEVLEVGAPACFLIGDTGVRSKTLDSVSLVRHNWQRDRQRFEGLFDEIGSATRDARQALTEGALPRLGQLMNRNQTLLRELDVSSPELDCLVNSALDAGALGAKLSGGGKGGCMIALVCDERRGREDVGAALMSAGAAHVYATVVR